MRHGPGPTNRSRGTVAKACTTAGDRRPAVKRNSSAKASRAVSMSKARPLSSTSEEARQNRWRGRGKYFSHPVRTTL